MRVIKQCILLIWGVLTISGCASNVQLSVKHPSEINMGAAKSVKVGSFSVGGKVDMSAINHSGTFATLVGNWAVSNIAAPSDSKVENAQRQGLADAIRRNGYFQVSESGAVDATIDGSVTYNIADRITEAESDSGNNGKKVKTYALVRKTDVTVNFRVTDKGGSMLGSFRVSSASEGKWEGATPEEARNRALSLDTTSLVVNELPATYSQVLRKIAPYYTTESRRLREGKSDQIKKGNDAAEDGKWQEAVQKWNEGMNSGKVEDRVAAIHNSAVYDEVMDKLEDALKKYEEVYLITNNADDAQDIDRVRARINEEATLKQAEKLRNASISP